MATTTINMERKGFNIRWRYVIALIIVIPVLAHLVFAIMRSPLTNYYVTVDELLSKSSSPATGSGGRVRVGGPIVPGSIEWSNTARSLTFQLEGGARPLTVTYRGLAPDSFREGATVIVEGELNRDGTFAAYNVLVKCPHQYVPAI